MSRADAEARIDAVLGNVPNDELLDPSPAGLTTGTVNQAELQTMLGRPALLVAAFTDQIREYLIRVYDTQIGDQKPGLPAGQRDARLREIDAKLLELGIAEETLISGLEDQGVDVIRRPDADPRIALGIDIRRPAA